MLVNCWLGMLSALVVRLRVLRCYCPPSSASMSPTETRLGDYFLISFTKEGNTSIPTRSQLLCEEEMGLYEIRTDSHLPSHICCCQFTAQLDV